MTGTQYGLTALVMWSVTSVLVALLAAIPPFEMMGAAFFTGFLLMGAGQVARREPILSYWKQPFANYLFWLLGPGLYTIMLYFAFKLAPPFEVNILNYLWPILLVIFASAMHNVSLNRLKILGVLAAFIGLVVVMLPPAGEHFFDDFNRGHAMTLLCATLWASYSAMRKKREYPMGFLAPAFFVFSMICFGLHFTFETTVIPGHAGIFVLLLLGITRLSYAYWDRAMKDGDVILLTSLSYFLPLISTILLVAFDFGPARPMIGLGAALIIAGCLMVNTDKIVYYLNKRT